MDIKKNTLAFLRRNVDKAAHFGVAYFCQDLIFLVENNSVVFFILTTFLLAVLFLKELIDSIFSWLDLFAGVLGIVVSVLFFYFL